MTKSKNRKLAKAKCDKYFSLYVRLKFARNGLCQCVTCGTWHAIKKIHTGHFMSRRFESTRFEEKNCAPQCVSCNTFHQGRQFKFAQWIDKTYGDGTAEKLEQKSKMKCFRKQYDYEVLADYYKQKVDELKCQ